MPGLSNTLENLARTLSMGWMAILIGPSAAGKTSAARCVCVFVCVVCVGSCVCVCSCVREVARASVFRSDERVWVTSIPQLDGGEERKPRPSLYSVSSRLNPKP